MKILSVASAIPEYILTNDEILERVRKDSEGVVSKKDLDAITKKIKSFFRLSGTKERHCRAKGERAFDFAKKAAEDALERASLRPEDIDLLMYVGVGRGWVEPGTSNMFQYELGMKNATSFDLLDACLSWLRAIHVSYHFIKNGVYKNIMIMNAEFNREYGNFEIHNADEVSYRFAQLTIGEAATATIVSTGKTEIEPYFEFKTDGSLHTLCKIPLPQIGQYCDKEKCPNLDPLIFFAYSNELFNAAQDMVPKLYFSSPELQKRKVVDIVFGHSASKTIIDKIERTLGHAGKTINIYPQFGNTVSATVPVAMAWALEKGLLKRGMKMLIAMGSAGFSVGICHMEY